VIGWRIAVQERTRLSEVHGPAWQPANIGVQQTCDEFLMTSKCKPHAYDASQQPGASTITAEVETDRGPVAPAIRTLLINDQAISLEMAAHLFREQSDIELVGTAGSVEFGLKVLTEITIDLVLLDIFGQSRRLRFLARARHQGFKGPVLILSDPLAHWPTKVLLAYDPVAVLPRTSCIDLVLDTASLLATGTYVAVEPGAQQIKNRGNNTFTRRQRDVLRAVFRGLTNNEISTRLGISEYCVKTALCQLFDITGVRTRGRLIRLALERYSDQL
jgi:DNA-binding NarL/FixJ family response regulator